MVETDTQVLRVTVAGALGSMGAFVSKAILADPELHLAAAVDPRFADATTDAFPAGVPRFTGLEAALEAAPADVVVEFTLPSSVRENVLISLERQIPVVVGATGLSLTDLREISRRSLNSATPVFVAPNFAIGAVLMMRFAREAARVLESAEIVELHHDRKLDRPSGTAARTASLIQKTWERRGLKATAPIHSVRLPGLVAHQEVIFGGQGETLTIRHDSLSRDSFLPGILLAVKRVRQLQGLVVGLEKIL